MNKDELLTETKCIITSLLTSNPVRCSMRQLCNDFEKMEGYSIPFRQLGFESIEQYLRSIPDTIVVYGYGPSAEVEGVIKPKSAHINLMVLKQKSTAPRYRRKFQRIPPPPRFQPQFTSNFGYQQNQRQHYPTTNTQYPTTSTYKCSQSSTNQALVQTSTETDKNSKSFNEEHNNNIKASQCRDEVKDVDTTENHVVVDGDNDFDDYKSKVSRDVQNNLRMLIKQFPNGILCSQMPTEYRNIFKKGLHYERFNYRSLIEMCSDLPDIFNYVKIGSDDFRIYSKNVPERDLKKHETPEKRLENDSEEEMAKTNDFLCDIPKEELSTLIPSDVVNICDKIPPCFATLNLKEGDYLDVSIAEIYDLSKFYVYVTYDGLHKLMNDMQKFFKQYRNKYLIPPVLFEKGLYCVALYLGEYHRAIIINVLPKIEESIRILFIDYGTVGIVSCEEVWYLPKIFSKLPSQAIRTRLSNIYPVTENRPWTVEIIRIFREMVDRKPVVAEITRIDKEAQVLEVYLADISNEDKVFFINDKLVKDGYALFTNQPRKKAVNETTCLPKVKYIHLYPEFYELESGYAYSGSDLTYAIEQKVPLHHSMPEYFHCKFKENFTHIDAKLEEFTSPELNCTEPIQNFKKPFDFSFFPSGMVQSIKDITRNMTIPSCCELPVDDAVPENTLTQTKAEIKCEYSDSDLINRSCDEKLNNLTINNHLPCDNSFGDNSFVSMAKEETIPLNNTLKKRNLNSSDLSVINNITKPFKSTNPFRNGSLLNANEIKPFVFSSTNPFLKDIQEEESRSNRFLKLFTKPEDQLNKTIDINLSIKKIENKPIPDSYFMKTSNPGNKLTQETSCLGNAANSSGLSVITPSINNSRFSRKQNSGVEERSRSVRTPPGFESLQLRPLETNPVSTFPNNPRNVNPFYQRFPSHPINNNNNCYYPCTYQTYIPPVNTNYYPNYYGLPFMPNQAPFQYPTQPYMPNYPNQFFPPNPQFNR